MVISATDKINGTQATKGAGKSLHTNPNATPNTIKVAEKKTTDEFGLTKVSKPEGLKTITHTVKSGDSFMKIAKHYGIDQNDVVAQLKDKKALPADYNMCAPQKSDPKCMGEGKTITLSIPKNDAQRAEYKSWMKYERAHYQKCIESGHSNSLAAVETNKPSFTSLG